MSAAPTVLVPPPGSAPMRREPLARRRPVSTFVALFVLPALLLGALGVSGVLAPRLETQGWADATSAAGERTWVVEVHNAGLAPVEVEAATWPVHGAVDAELLLVRPGRRGPTVGGDRADTFPFSPFTLGAGEMRTLMVRGVRSCPSGGPGPPVEAETLTLEVRSVLGRRQSIDVGPGPFASPRRIPPSPEAPSSPAGSPLPTIESPGGVPPLSEPCP